MSAQSYVVIGGGMVGAASALRLRAAGFDVTLVDPGDKRRGASFGNIGHIAAEQCEPLAAPDTLRTFAPLLFAFGGPLDFRWRDIGLWAPWALRFIGACTTQRAARAQISLTALLSEAMPAWQRLLEIAEAPRLVRGCGHAIVWMDARRGAASLAAWKRAAIGGTSFREMTRDELAGYAAGMRTAPAAGILFTGTGQVEEPQALRDALLAAFVARGGRIVHAAVTGITPRSDGVSVALGDGSVLDASAALVSAGAWSGALMRLLGIAAPVIGERGYSIQSSTHAWPENLPPTVFEERSIVVSRFSSGLRASSFLEFGRPDAPGDPRKWRKLQAHLGDLGIGFAATPDRWVGPRPTLPDYLPAIGRLERYQRVLYAFGHQHLGITMSAITSELVAALALGEAPKVDLEPLRVERFS